MLPKIQLGALIALVSFLSTQATCWDQCSDDFLGAVVQVTPHKMNRVYLEPFEYQLVVPVPKMCSITEGVGAHACAQDVAPFVKVVSENEVVVQRRGAGTSEIYVDITAYCSKWYDRNAITKKTLP